LFNNLTWSKVIIPVFLSIISLSVLKIPTNPNVIYKNSGWISFSDWIGNTSYKSVKNIKYLRYLECKDYIKLNFERYGKCFHNLFFLNFNLGGLSNNFKKYQNNYSLFNKIKFFIFKLIGPKFYAIISYKIKNYKRIK
jgi:hypothetical protein